MAQNKLVPAWFWNTQGNREKDAKETSHLCVREKAFHAKHGEAYQSMNHLAEGLYKMPHDAFVHHANSAKNDFASWVGDVFGNHELASTIKTIKNPVTMAKAIEEKIK